MASTNLRYRAGNVHICNCIYQKVVSLLLFLIKSGYPCSPPIYKKNLIFMYYYRILKVKILKNFFLIFDRS
jgi:hypothetical protein